MNDRHFTAKDGLEIQAWKFIPENPKAVVQLIHGSLEYAARYQEFIEVLTKHNIAVYAMDLRGHGETAVKSDSLNIFSKDDDGWGLALDDLAIQLGHIKADLPGLPIMLMGHSMGSFLARDIASSIGESYDGLILSGTGRATALLTYSGIFLAKIFKLFSRNKPNALLHQLVYGTLNDKFKNARTDYDFLSRDEKVVDNYIADPLCGQLITPEYGHELASGVLKINKNSAYTNTPSQLPIYLFSGADDPVGGERGNYVHEVAALYEKSGHDNVTVKLWPDGRHETLNELNKEDVYQAVLDWIELQIKKNDI